MNARSSMEGDAALVDAAGTRHEAAGPDARIVSLVPSLTELICELGLAAQLVGRTGFCIHPREAVRAIPKVGGTKTVDLDKVRSLGATHLIVNIEENGKATVDALAAVIPNVVVTHPLAPEDNLALYRLIAGIFGVPRRGEHLCRQFEQARARLARRCEGLERERVLYVIWHRPWMTVSRDTYISRMLALAGWDTEPAVAARRYPAIELDAPTLSAMDHVLLSSEPYPFRSADVRALQAMLPPSCRASVRLVDAEMISWYGSRAVRGLDYLAELRLWKTGR